MFIREYFFSIQTVNDVDKSFTHHTGFIKHTSFFPQPSRVLSRAMKIAIEDGNEDIVKVLAFNRIDN